MTLSNDIKKELSISDDSGFLAIVNSETYNSFISEDWQLNELFAHFISEINKTNILIWATGFEKQWNVTFSIFNSSNRAFRELTSLIKVTEGKLYLANYEDLTMAAQFISEKIPQSHNSDKKIYIDNGNYFITLRQMFDAENNQTSIDSKVDFEIIFTKIEANKIKQNDFKNIPWLK